MKLLSEKAIVPLKNLLFHFSSNYRIWHTPSKFLSGSTKFFDNYGASYEIISLTPKRLLKTCVFEKHYLPNEQNVCTVFSLVIEHDERQGTFQNSTEGILTFIGQVMRPFHHFFRNKEVDRINFLKKDGYRPCDRKKKFRPFFLRATAMADIE